VQADGKRDLELGRNRGDAGDAYPGTSANTAITPTSTPSSGSYGGQDTAVSLTGISPSGPTMTATVSVSPAPMPEPVSTGRRTAGPAPQTNGRLAGALAKLKSDVSALEQLVGAGSS